MRIRVVGEKKVANKNERRGRGRDSWREEEIALKNNRLFLKEADSSEEKEILEEEKTLLIIERYRWGGEKMLGGKQVAGEEKR